MSVKSIDYQKGFGMVGTVILFFTFCIVIVGAAYIVMSNQDSDTSENKTQKDAFDEAANQDEKLENTDEELPDNMARAGGEDIGYELYYDKSLWQPIINANGLTNGDISLRFEKIEEMEEGSAIAFINVYSQTKSNPIIVDISTIDGVGESAFLAQISHDDGDEVFASIKLKDSLVAPIFFEGERVLNGNSLRTDIITLLQTIKLI